MHSLFFRRWSAILLAVMFIPVAQAFSGAAADVAARERDWRIAWVKGDVSMLERLHGPDYIAINNEGRFTSRAQVLADVRAGRFRYSSMRHTNMRIRVYGRTAVVTGITLNTGWRGQRDVSGTFAYTRVYVKDQATWRAVLAQYTRPRLPPQGR